MADQAKKDMIRDEVVEIVTEHLDEILDNGVNLATFIEAVIRERIVDIAREELSLAASMPGHYCSVTVGPSQRRQRRKQTEEKAKHG